jgi:hypothetical protein
MSTYGAITTTTYKAREAAHAAGGALVTFATFAVGDGAGAVPSLSSAPVALVRELYRAGVNGVSVNPNNAAQIDIQCVIPNAAGSFTIREIAVFDTDGAKLVAAISNIVKTTEVDGMASDFNLTVSIVIADATAVVITSSDSSFATDAEIEALEIDIADLYSFIAVVAKQLVEERNTRHFQRIAHDETTRRVDYLFARLGL